MNGPLFITGTYRAGTTWVSLLLNNHPEVSVGLHTTNWPRERHASAGAAVDYARERFDVELARPDLLESMGSSTYPVGWAVALGAILGTDGWIGEKMQLEWRRIADLLGDFPESRVIHIVRDPRSVLASFREYTYTEHPKYVGAVFNCLDSMRYGIRYREDLPEDRYHLLRYEDIALRTAEQLKRAMRWLCLPWPGEDVMLSTDGWSELPGSRWQDRSSFGRVDEDFDVEQAVARWKGNLSADERAFCEWVCWREMDRLGYQHSHEIRPYALSCHQLVSEVRDCEHTELMLERWMDTGEGTCAFPNDPTMPENRTENREAVA